VTTAGDEVNEFNSFYKCLYDLLCGLITVNVVHNITMVLLLEEKVVL